MQPHLVSISPYEIKRLIDEHNLSARRQRDNPLNLEQIWKQLGIYYDKNDFAIEDCYGDCHANVVTLELDGNHGMETMLILDAMNGYRFLIFKRVGAKHEAGAQWCLLGYIDASRWLIDPQYRVVAAGTKRWLAINEIYGHGSGFGSDVVNWYEVSESGVTNVLCYQSGLGIATWLDGNPGIIRKTNLVKAEYKDGITTILLQSSTSYEGYLEQADFFPLWTNKRKAFFIKGPGMQKFFFDALHSEMIEKELDPAYGDQVFLTNEQVLKYNYRDLEKIALRGDAKQKEWLRNFLNGIDNTVEKQSLQKALGEARP